MGAVQGLVNDMCQGMYSSDDTGGDSIGGLNLDFTSGVAVDAEADS
jgi:hypothetical protein